MSAIINYCMQLCMQTDEERCNISNIRCRSAIIYYCNYACKLMRKDVILVILDVRKSAIYKLLQLCMQTDEERCIILVIAVITLAANLFTTIACIPLNDTYCLAQKMHKAIQ